MGNDLKGTWNKVIAYSFTPRGKGFPDDKWDFGFLQEAFTRNNVEVIKVNKLPETDRAFVVVPGFEWTGREDVLNENLSRIKRLVLFITADELGVFGVDKISHPNAEIWVQYPYPRHQAYNKLPLGVPNHKDDVVPDYPEKTTDIYFAGQITHQRREQLAKALKRLPDAVYRLTEGFTQGETPKDYYKLLASARFAPAPAGAASIDSFRFYEGLEMLALPIADNISSVGEAYGFWDILFKDMPIQQIKDWNKLRLVIPQLLEKYPANMHQAVSWWIKQKRDFAYKIMEQINEH
jgi:hypothetical protein